MSTALAIAGNDIVLELTAGALAAYQEPRLTDLLAWLRIELGDVLENGNEAGTWSDSELVHFLNRAKTEVELQTRCHQVRVAVTVVAGTHTYDTSPVFAPEEVSVGGATLTKQGLPDMATVSSAWDGAEEGAPAQWLPLTGSSLRIYPPPDEDTEDEPLVVHGAAVSDALVAGNDTVTSIPAGYASDVLLEGAKVLAYRSRSSNPVNVALGTEAAGKFEALCGAIRARG